MAASDIASHRCQVCGKSRFGKRGNCLAHYLGIDIGTSAVKAVIVNEAQGAVAEAELALAVQRRHPGWSEQNPQDWWRAVENVLDELRAKVPRVMPRIEAIGLSGQMHGAVLLGADMQPLRPAMLWNDARSGAEAERLAQDNPDLPGIVGVVPMPGLTAPKIPWLARHEPEILEKLHKIILPKDYIRLQMTGECITDMSDAAGTWWLDQARRDWCDAALAATGLTRAQMPRLVEGHAVAGHLSRDLALRWGLRPGIPVAGGGGDAAAGAVGIGAINPGDAFLSLGTSGQLFVTTPDYRPAPADMVHAFCHALPGRWFQMGAMLSAASCLAWAADVFGVSAEVLAQEAQASYLGPSSLLFLPYLTGERTPHNDPNAKGVLFGINPATTRAEITQAIMEGVAFSFADARDALAQSGTLVERAGVIGGGTRSQLWLQIISDLLGIELVRYRASARGPAFGAARLAMLAATGADPARVCTPPEIEGTIVPRFAVTLAYAPRIQRYRRLYRALKPEFAA